ncbi:uncharacterized protein LOC111046535 [Nilaparvata lugens]|uniref:uncharacterized protein LOC111046535 n=1 Tax=Nilaparvata lugens TaxID=108931 RepID=UPI00193CF657|nr:uncharacterized protein LOC111046535 [Nilaparvata lugens]
MTGEKINLIILKECSDIGNEPIIEKCMEWGILKREVNCPACAKDNYISKMKLRKDVSLLEGYKWSCNKLRSKNKKKRKRCSFSMSLRGRTFFGNSKLPIWRILSFIHLWTKNVSTEVMSEELEMSKATVLDWCSFCREVTYDAMMVRNKKIGKKCSKVQLGKYKFGEKRCNKGKVVEGQWALGGIDELSGEIFMATVEKITSETLIQIIQKYVESGTTIVSNLWKELDCLKEEGFEQLKMNNEMNFIIPDTGSQTLKIDAVFRAAKTSLLRCHKNNEFFSGHVSKYLFDKSCKLRNLNPFIEFCKEAGNLYNPDKKETDPEII